jgi:hypothetical protein
MIRVQSAAMQVLASEVFDNLAAKQPIPGASRQRREHANGGGPHRKSVDSTPILGFEHAIVERGTARPVPGTAWSSHEVFGICEFNGFWGHGFGFYLLLVAWVR